jgi:hypothetical protein
VAKCQSTLELARHLSSALIDQCEATREEASQQKIDLLAERFNALHKEAQSKEATLRETR